MIFIPFMNWIWLSHGAFVHCEDLSSIPPVLTKNPVKQQGCSLF